MNVIKRALAMKIKNKSNEYLFGNESHYPSSLLLTNQSDISSQSHLPSTSPSLSPCPSLISLSDTPPLLETDENKDIAITTNKTKNKKFKLILIEPEEEKKKNLKWTIDTETKFSATQKTILATKSKQEEWVCQDVPCIVISENEDNIRIKPFNKSGVYSVSTDIYKEHFRLLDRDEEFIYTQKYPTGKIPISEFNVQPITINLLKKHFKECPQLIKLLEKAELDSYCGKGSSFCINIKKFNEYKEETNHKNKLERIGDPIFNRTVRHTTPIPGTFTYEDFELCPSFPAPIGIRAEDFALPSEQNEIFCEMLTQIFNCVNAPECPLSFQEELGIVINPNSHICEWCGEKIDISEINQDYCSREHSINFCHRDPSLGTKKGNVYIGHCSCNREQGGYSEEQRIMQIIRLAKHNSLYRNMLLKELEIE
jgi:hypothetical protein